MSQALLHTALALIKELPLCTASIQLLRNELDRKAAALPTGLEVDAKGHLRPQKKQSPMGFTYLDKKKKWGSADIQAAVDLFADKLPLGVYAALGVALKKRSK